MTLFLKYLKHHRKLFAVLGLFCVIFLVTFSLYHLPIKAVIYPIALCVISGLFFLALDFKKAKHSHEMLMKVRSITDAMENILPEPEGIKDSDYREIIRILGEEHGNFRADSDRKYSDMIDYYTVWAHQIKTPIASMKLTLQNEDSELSRKLSGDLYRIEQYVEMVLTFLRLNSNDSDYVIKAYDLDKIIKQSVKKFTHDFIGRKLSLIYEPVNAHVITDEKWLSFVIEQVLSNALKYTQAGSITISMDESKKLTISDTGIGIAPEDLPRIFENGYTGFNGRLDKRASGIGLYLCKRICTNLGHEITAESVVGEGTTITIDLSQRKTEIE